jgi:hypothetical protein
MAPMSNHPSQRLLIAASACAACAAWFFIAAGVVTFAQTPSPSGTGAATFKTRNVILITLDGARTQEIFGGLDDAVFRAQLTKEKKTPEQSDVYKRFAGATPEERRRKLMPFFWDTWMAQHGSIGGNRARNSTFQLTNTHRFSYRCSIS